VGVDVFGLDTTAWMDEEGKVKFNAAVTRLGPTPDLDRSIQGDHHPKWKKGRLTENWVGIILLILWVYGSPGRRQQTRFFLLPLSFRAIEPQVVLL
jgi:hypothetical protein